MATSFSISAGTNRVRITKISANGREVRHIEPRSPGSISIDPGDVLRIRELPNTGTERARPHQVRQLAGTRADTIIADDLEAPNSTTGGQDFTVGVFRLDGRDRDPWWNNGSIRDAAKAAVLAVLQRHGYDLPGVADLCAGAALLVAHERGAIPCTCGAGPLEVHSTGCPLGPAPECTCGGGPDDLHGIGCPARAFVGVGAAARQGQRLAHQAAVRSLDKEPLQDGAGHPVAPRAPWPLDQGRRVPPHGSGP